MRSPLEKEEMPWIPRGSLKGIKNPKNKRETRINRLLEQYDKLEDFCLRREDKYEELVRVNTSLIDCVKEIIEEHDIPLCKNSFRSMWANLRPHLKFLCRTCATRNSFRLENYQTGLTDEKGRGYIYFIELNWFIKIGMTRKFNPFERITAYKTENPGRLKLLWLIETYNSVQLEKKLHEIFTEKGYHHNREWFNITPITLINVLSSLREIYRESKAIFMLKHTYDWFNRENAEKCSTGIGGEVAEADRRDREAKMRDYYAKKMDKMIEVKRSKNTFTQKDYLDQDQPPSYQLFIRLRKVPRAILDMIKEKAYWNSDYQEWTSEIHTNEVLSELGINRSNFTTALSRLGKRGWFKLDTVDKSGFRIVTIDINNYFSKDEIISKSLITQQSPA